MLEEVPNQNGNSMTGLNMDDLMVRSEDFFSAIHAIMSIKQNRHRIEGKTLKVRYFHGFFNFFFLFFA